MDNSDRNILFGCLAALGATLVLFCCCCLALWAAGFLLVGTSVNTDVWTTLSVLEVTPEVQVTLRVPGLRTPTPAGSQSGGSDPLGPPPDMPTPEFFEPGKALTPGAPDPTAAVFLNAAEETLHTLETTIVPVNDPIELAQRLQGMTDAPRSLQAPVENFAEGDKRTFWVTNSDDNTNFEVEASLAYIGQNVYFWVEDGVRYNERDLKRLVDTFDSEIYPRNREFFGSEWTPGVDADPRLFILYARNIGSSVAGYFSSADSYLPQVREFSNGHEMFLLSADHVDLREEFAYSVLAHEFQHMIHWYRDRNEETWMNEGFSDLAMLLNDYDIGGADRSFISNPDLQLNDWPTTPENRTAHYGAAFMFLAYYLDRFGDEATQALVAEPDNGMVSIDKVLSSLNKTDAATGKVIGADDLFADWVVTNYLKDEDIGDGRYTYHNYSQAPQASETETLQDCPTETLDRDVYQYGADYIQIRCQGDYTLRFVAPQMVNALPTDPHSGQYAFYSNRGDESDITLTREFDFSGQTGKISLSYWTWYDLEEDYDYLYLLASEDGQTWKFITTPSGTADDPVGNSYGWGYNAASGGGPEWIEEKVDLSEYAGKKVTLRFEYITDAAVNGEGFLLDDVSIPEIKYSADFEADDGGWESQGFVRIQNVLPQTYRLSLIYVGSDPRVETVPLPESNAIEIPLSIGGDVKEIILVVSGTSRFTRQKAFYQYAILPR